MDDKVKKPPKLIAAIRHGNYDRLRDGKLTEDGRRQAQVLAQKLRLVIPQEYSIKIFSSPRPRGQETATIIGSLFGVGFEVVYSLGSQDYTDGEYKRRDIMGSAGGHDVIVVVTHHESPSGIISAFRELHFKQKFDRLESKKGDGVMINLTTGNIIPSLLEHSS